MLYPGEVVIETAVLTPQQAAVEPVARPTIAAAKAVATPATPAAPAAPPAPTSQQTAQPPTTTPIQNSITASGNRMAKLVEKRNATAAAKTAATSSKPVVTTDDFDHKPVQGVGHHTVSSVSVQAKPTTSSTTSTTTTKSVSFKQAKRTEQPRIDKLMGIAMEQVGQQSEVEKAFDALLAK